MHASQFLIKYKHFLQSTQSLIAKSTKAISHNQRA